VEILGRNIKIHGRTLFVCFCLIVLICQLFVSTASAGWIGIGYSDVAVLSPNGNRGRSVLAAGKSSTSMSVVRFGDASLMSDSRKVIITGVIVGSPAHLGGLQVRDEILAIQNKTISVSSQIPTILQPLAEKTLVSIKVRRGKEELVLNVELGNPEASNELFKPMQTYFEMAKKQFEKGNILQAIEAMEKLIDIQPVCWGEKSDAMLKNMSFLYPHILSVFDYEKARKIEKKIIDLAVYIYGENTNKVKEYRDKIEANKLYYMSLKSIFDNNYTKLFYLDDTNGTLEKLNKNSPYAENGNSEEILDDIYNSDSIDYFGNAVRFSKFLEKNNINTSSEIIKWTDGNALKAARALAMRGYYLDSTQRYEKVLLDNKHSSDPLIQMNVTKELISMYSILGLHKKARSLVADFEKLVENNRGKEPQAYPKRLAQIAICYLSLMDQGKAKEFYNHAILAVKDLSPNNEIETALSLLEICEILSYVDIEKTKEIAEEASNTFKKYTDTSKIELAKISRYLATTYSYTNVDKKTISILYSKTIQSLIKINPIPAFDLVETIVAYARFFAGTGDNFNCTKLYLDALAISQKYYGVPRSDIMLEMARHYDQKAAHRLRDSALEISGKVYGQNNLISSSVVLNIAMVEGQNFTSDKARESAEKSYLKYLDLVTESVGENSPSYKAALQQLASFYDKFDKEKAKDLMAQAASVVSDKEDHDDEISQVIARENYANNIMDINGDYIQALGIYKETVKTKKNLLGEKDEQYLSSLGVLAWLYQLTGEYQKAIVIYKSANDPLRLAGVYQSLGEYQRVIEIMKQFQLQNKDEAIKPMTAAGIQEAIADASLKLGDYQEAARYYQLSLDTIKEAFPGIFVDSMPSIGTGKLYGLAESYEGLGESDKAEFFYKKVLEYEKAGPAGMYGPEGFILAGHMIGLARFYNRSGQWEQASPLLESASTILANTLGKQHPDYSEALSEQSLMLGSQGFAIKSFDKQAEALELQGAFVERLATWADESRLQSYTAKMENNYDLLYSLLGENFPGSDDDIKHALELHLNYKGRIMEVLSTRARFAVLSKDPKVSNLIEELRLTTARISQLQLNPPKLEAEKLKLTMEALEEKRQQLEESLASQSAEFAKIRATSDVTVTELLDALPPSSVYIDFVDYRKFDYEKNKWTDDRYYLAFLVKAGDDGQSNVTIMDLGPTKAINEMVKRLRHEIAGGGAQQRGVAGVRPVVVTNKSIDNSSKNTTPAEDLYRALFEHMEEEVLNAQTIFIAPSGNLNLIPLELSSKPASNMPLSDDYEFIYCLGKDLVSQKQVKVEKEHPKDSWISIVAAPDFADPREASLQEKGLQQSVVQPLARGDVNGWPVIFESLPGTMQEADTIQALAGARTKVIKMTGEDATEAAFKNLHRPSVLHVATHGFFLEVPRESSRIGMRGIGGVRNADDEKILSSPPRLFNPSLRSGLALAGANRLAENKLVPEGEEDGILMAAEVVGMDLFGTDLVVLSACETGLGEVQRGEGVFGLRRAFKIAGVKNILMSLWSVPDEETVWLMEAFYKSYFSGNDPANALRDARQVVRARLIERDGVDNPYYWAAFILEGTGS